MRQNLTDITLVVDRSGSMEACREEAQGGINSFIREQKQVPGEALFTLVQFDTEYEFVHKGAPMDSIPTFKLVPRGNTALLDAVGKAINEAGERFDKTPEENRPGLVVFVIVTDGRENASKEFTRTQIHEMVERQQNRYSWKFVYLGANQNAFDEASTIGIRKGLTANYRGRNAGAAYASTSSNIRDMRMFASRGDSNVAVDFTDDQRDKMA